MTTEVVDKEAQQIWDDLRAKEAAEASGVTDPPSIESADKTTGGEGDTTEVKTTDAPSNDDAKDKAADDKSAPDIWANADPALRTAYEAVLKDRDDKIAHAKRVGGTVAGYQRQVDDLKRQLAELTKGSTKTDDTTGTTTGIFDDPEIKKAADEYPEIFGPLKKVVSNLEQRAMKAERELGTISAERRDANLEEQARIVDDAHPDYDQIAQSPEFVAWYDKAPAYLRAAIQRNAKVVVDGEEVAHVLKIYKQETGYKPKDPPASDPAPGSQKPSSTDKRALQLESASGVRPRGSAKKSDGVPDDPEAAWEYWRRMDAAQA
jgi:hypothetical protein